MEEYPLEQRDLLLIPDQCKIDPVCTTGSDSGKNFLIIFAVRNLTANGILSVRFWR